MDQWIIQPLKSVGSLEFGATPKDVEKVLGPPEQSLNIADNFVGLPDLQEQFKYDVAEYRIFGNVDTQKPTVTFRKNALINIAFGPQDSSLSIFDTPIYKTSRQKLIDILTEKCSTVLITDNHYTIYFMDIGVNMAAAKHAKKEPEVGVWSAGVYDHLLTSPDYIRLKG